MDPAPPPPRPVESLRHLRPEELPARHFSPDVGPSPIAPQEEQDKHQGALGSKEESWEDQPRCFNFDQSHLEAGEEKDGDALDHCHLLDWVAVSAAAIGVCGCCGGKTNTNHDHDFCQENYSDRQHHNNDGDRVEPPVVLASEEGGNVVS